MRTEKVQLLFAASAIIFTIVFGASGFTNMSAICMAFLGILAYTILYIEQVLRDRYTVKLIQSREDARNCAEAQEYEMWCQVVEESQRRKLMREIENMEV